MLREWFPHVTVAAVVERNGRFLMVKERIGGRIVVNQPAGHLEARESLVAAVRREMLEETGWKFEPCALVGVYRWVSSANDTTYLRFAFSGSVDHHDTTRPLAPEIECVVWMTPAEIRSARHMLRSPQVLATLDDYLRGRRYPLACLCDVESISDNSEIVS